jgi:hypothetical protein
MSQNQESAKRPYEEIVYEAKARAFKAREQVRREILSGQSVSYEARLQLAQAACAYRDALWDYKDKRQRVAQGWDDSDVDRIQELLNQTVQVPVSTAGDTVANSYEERPALMTADPNWLIGVTKQLDDIAANLDFIGRVHQGRELGKVGGDPDGKSA